MVGIGIDVNATRLDVGYNDTAKVVAFDNDAAGIKKLLKALPGEDERDKAAVYMEGLAQMRNEWARAEKKKRKR